MRVVDINAVIHRVELCPLSGRTYPDSIDARADVVSPVARVGSRVATMTDRHFADLVCALARVRPFAGQLSDWAAGLVRVLAGGGRLLACGSGGSAALAQHLTAELMGRFQAEPEPVSALALPTDTSASTAIVNDCEPEEVYAREVRAYGRPGDLLVSLSTSGTSDVVLAAVKTAQEIGVTTWSLTGPAPNPLLAISDEAICVDAESTSTVQEVHLVLLHSLCLAVDEVLLGRSGCCYETDCGDLRFD